MKFKESFVCKFLASSLVLTFSFWSLPIYAVAADDAASGKSVLPSGLQTVAGSIDYSVSADGKVGTLNAPGVSIGNWTGGFNIGSPNTFNANVGTHLSRDTSGNPSEIFGKLNATGNFFLVNSSGIYFGPSAQVNAPGLVASTLDIMNEDFLAGRYHFKQNGGAASLINEGAINAGKGGAVLLGGSVENTGVIAAKEGNIQLASGSEATVNLDGDGMLSAVVDQAVTGAPVAKDGTAVKDAVLNKGIVRTQGGNVLMTAKAADNIFDSLVNNEGIVEAQSLGSKNGSIVLSSDSNGIVKNSGTLDATGKNTGETGGTIKVLGDTVGILDGSKIDASGDAGGGTVLIGGNYQGQGTEKNANVTYVAPTATIKADAIAKGDGGKVVVWSDKQTTFDGAISAKGGILGGNGGLVETSGENLYANGTVDASAVNGRAGNWLLDPTDITIKNTPPNHNLGTSGTNPLVYKPTGSNSTVSASTIQTALNGGTSVTITTVGSPSTPGDSGNITVSEDILKNGGADATLELDAVGNITVNNSITATMNKLNMIFNGQTGITVNNTVKTNGGSFTANADTDNNGVGTFTITGSGSVLTQGGNVSITSADIALAGALNAAAGSTTLLATNGRSIGLGAGAGDYSLSDSELGKITTNNLTIGNATNGDITVDGVTAANTAGIAGLTMLNATGAGHSVTFSGNASTFSSGLAANANTDVNVNKNLTTGGDMTLTAGHQTNLNADLINTGSGKTITVNGQAVVGDIDGNPSTVDTVNVTTNNGNVNFNGKLDGTQDDKQALGVHAGTGDVTFGDSIGSAHRLYSLSLDSTGVLSFPNLVNVLNAALSNLTLGNDTNIELAGTFSIGNVNTNGHDFSIKADEINFTGGAGSIFGGGNLVLAPFTAGLKIVVAGISELANQLDLTTTDLAALADGFNSITIGRADGTGGIDINAFTFLDPITFLSPVLGAINVNGALHANEGVTFTGSGHTTHLLADIITLGADIVINDNVLLDNNVSLQTSNGNVKITGTVDGAHDLGVAAGTGNTEVDGAIGGTTALTSLTVNNASASTVTLKNGVKTTGDQSIKAGTINTQGTQQVTGSGHAITLTGDVSLQNNTALTTNNGNVTVTGAVTGAKDLTVTAGTGSVDLQSAVNINSLGVNSANTARFGSNVTTAAAQNVTAGTIQTNGTHTASNSGAAINLNGNVSLQNDTHLNTNNGNVSVTGTIDGAKALGVSAGSGSVGLNGNVGSGANLSSLTVNNAGGSTTFGGNVTTTGNQSVTSNTINTNGAHTAVTAGSVLSFLGNLFLQNNTSLNTTNGNVTVTGKIDGGKDLAVTAGSGNLNVTDKIGGTTALNSLTVNSAGTSTFGDNVTTTGAQSITSGTINTNGAHAASAINLNGNVQLQKNTTLDTSAANGNIGVTGTIDSAAGKSLTANAGTGNVSLAGATGSTNALSALSATGTSIALKAVKTTGAQTYNGNATLNGDLQSTAGGAIHVTGTTTLAGDSAVSTSNDISLDGAVNGAKNLVLNSTAGNVALGSSVGNTLALQSLIASGVNIGLNAVTTTGNQSYTGSTTLNGGNLTTTNAGSSIALNGNTTLGADANLITNNGDITATGTVNGSHNLGITAGTGNVALQGNVGSGANLTSLTVNSANSSTFGGDVTTTGAQNFTAGNIKTNGRHIASAINLNGSVTLQNDTKLDTSAAGGNVSVTGTVDGAKNLEVDNGTGNLSFAGNVGSGTSLASLAVNSGLGGTTTFGGNVTTTGDQAIHSTNIQTNGTHTVTGSGHSILMNGKVSLVHDTTLNTNNGNVTVTGTVDSAPTFTRSLGINAGTGAVALQDKVGNSTALGTLTAAGATVNLNEVHTSGDQTFNGSTTLNGSLTSTGGSVTQNGDTTLGTGVTVTSGGAVGNNINFNGKIDGAQTLALNAGSGNASVSGSVGDSNPLTSLVASAANLIFHSVKTSGAQTYNGATTLNGDLNAAGGSVNVNGDTTLGNDVTVTSGSDINFNGKVDGTHALTLQAATGTASVLGSMGSSNPLTTFFANAFNGVFHAVKTSGNQTYTATNATTLNGDLTSTGGSVAVNGPTTLANDVKVTTGGSVGNDATFNGEVNGTTDGAQGLTVNAGSGNVAINGHAGTSGLKLKNIVLSGSNIGIHAVNTAGGQTYTGKTTLNGDLTAANAGAGITVNGSTVISNTAPGNLVTVTTNNGDVTFNGKTDGTTVDVNTGFQSLTVNAGSGNIAFNDSIGSAVKLLSLTLNNTGTQVLPTLINVANFVIANISLAADKIFNIGTGTFTNTNSINTNGHNLTVIADEINFTGGANSVSGGGNLVLHQFTDALKVVVASAAETAGQLDFTVPDLDAIANGFTSITLGSSTGTGGMDINAYAFKDPVSLLSTVAGEISLLGTLTGLDNASIFIQGSGHTFHMGADIVTAGNNVTINDNAIIEKTSALIDTTNGNAVATGANVTITGTTEGDTDGARNLALQAGTTGSVNLQGAVGGTNRLASLTSTGASSQFGGVVRTTGTQTYNGNTTFNGAVTAGDLLTINGATANLNADVTAKAITFTNAVNNVNLAGNVDLTTTNGALSASTGVFHLLGASGTNTITLNGDVLSNFAGFDATGNANLALDTDGSLQTGGFAIGGDLSVQLDKNANGAESMNTVGAINAASVNISGTGTNDTATFQGGIQSTTGSIQVANLNTLAVSNGDVESAASISLTNTNTINLGDKSLPINPGDPIPGVSLIAHNGSVDARTGVGGITLNFANAKHQVLSTGGSVSLADVTAAGDNDLAVSSQQNATLGNVNLNNGALSVAVDSDGNGSNSLTAGNLSAGSVALTGTNKNDNATLGTVTSTTGSVTADGFDTISATGNVASATSVTVSNTNTLDLAQNVNVTANNGNLDLTGVGSARLSGAAGTNTLTSNGGSVSTGAITSTGAANLTVNSQNNVTLASANVGGDLAVNVDTDHNGANTGTFGALTSKTLTVNGGTDNNDTLNFNGAVNTAGNVAVTGGPININNSITTTNGGSVTITNAGLLTIAALGDMFLDGAFTQNGAGAVTTAGDITTTGDTIDFASAVTLAGDVAFNTAGANIHFASTVDGTHNLTMNAGSTGDILMDAAVGMGTQLGAIIIQNAHDVTLATDKDIKATSIEQLAGSGTTSFTGNITTTGPDGIELVGNNFTLGNGAPGSDKIVTENGGELCITNAGTLILNADLSGVTGEFCQLGSGEVDLNVDITNFNGITFDGQVILGGNPGARTLDAGTNVITFGKIGTTSSSLNANGHDLNLIADEVDLLGDADTISSGGTNTLTITPYTQGQDITIGGVNGTSALDLTANEVATFNDTLASLPGNDWSRVYIGNVNGSGNITVHAITFTDPVTIRTPQAPGSLYIDGLITALDNASLTLDGSGSTTHFMTGADIVTAGGAVHIMDSVVVEALNFLIDTTNGGAVTTGGDITIDGAVNGNLFGQNNLTMNAGSAGNILLGSAVGLGNRLGALVFTNANNITTADLKARSIQQVDGQGTSRYEGQLNTDGAAGIDLKGKDFLFDVSSSVVTTQNGGVTIDNSGALNLSTSAGMSLDGVFLQKSTAGTGTVSTGADITTTADDITFNSPMTLTHHVTLDSAGGNIAINGKIEGTTAGAQDLTLIAGTGNPLKGDITLGDTAGATTRLGAVSIQHAHNFTANGITASEYAQSDMSGTSTFNGGAGNAINTNDVNGIQIAGNNVTIDGSVTTTNGGNMSVAQSGDLNVTANGDMNLNGAFSQTNGSLTSTVHTAGDITTSAGNDISFQAPITLTGNVALNAGRDIHFADKVNNDAGAHRNLDLTAARDINMDESIGGTASIGRLRILSARDVNASSGINADSIQQVAGSGTTTFNGQVNALAGTVDLTGNNFNVNQAVNVTGGNVSISHAGLLNIAAAGDMNITNGGSGSFVENGAGSVQTAGDIVTDGGSITFNRPTTLTGNVLMNNIGGDINFNNTLDGGFNLTLTGGNMLFNSAVGSAARLGALLVNSANNLTFNSTVKAASIQQNAGTGTTTFNDAVDTNAAPGIDLTTQQITFNNAPVQTTNGGVRLNNAGLLSINGVSDMDITGGDFNQVGAGAVVTAGDITTHGGSISFASPITLAGSVAMASNGGAMTFSGTIDGAQNLTLASGSGNILMNAAVGSGTRLGNLIVNSANNWTANGAIRAASIQQNAGTGTTTFNGALDTNAAPGIKLTGNNFAFNQGSTVTGGGNVDITHTGLLSYAAAAFTDLIGGGSYSEQGGGAVHTAANIQTDGGNVTFNDAVTLLGAIQITSAPGNINFLNTLDGGFDLTLSAGTGNILMDGAVGAAARLGNIFVNNVANWTAKSINAASITQTIGTGTTTFNGALNTNGAFGINLTGNNFNVNQSVTTTGGNVSIVHSGLLDIAAAGDMNIANAGAGSFVENGGGAVHTAGDVITDGGNIRFNDAVTLTGNVSMDSNGGELHFVNTVNSDGTPRNLTLESNAGNIVFEQSVGGLLGGRLGALTVTSANDWTANDSIFAQSITQNAGTGLSRFIGNLDANGAAGINLTGNNFRFDGSTLASAGSIGVLANFAAASQIDLNGPMTTAGGNVSLRTNGNINMAATGDVTTNGGNVLIQADQDGNGSGALTMTNTPADLTLIDSGSGTIRLLSGGDISLGRLISTNAGDSAITMISTNGRIIDGGDTVAYDVNDAAGGLSMSAANGIGLSTDPFGALETDVRRLSATTSTGDINIDSNSSLPLTIANASVTGGAGSILIRQLSAAGMTVGNASTVNGSITFQSIADLVVTGNITAAGALAAVTLTADSDADGSGNLTLAGGSVVNSAGPVALSGTAVNLLGTVSSLTTANVVSNGDLLLNLLTAAQFFLNVRGTVRDANGNQTNLIGGSDSTIHANVIGTPIDPIEVTIGQGDLNVVANAQVDGVSANLAGTIAGDLKVNLTPGLVMFNNIAAAGELMPFLNTGFSTAFNLIAVEPPFNNFTDIQSQQGLLAGNALSTRYEHPLEPSIDLAPLKSVVPVLVNVEEEKKWTRKARPTVPQTVIPPVETLQPTVVPAPAPAPVVPSVSLAAPVKPQQPAAQPAGLPLVPPMTPFPPTEKRVQAVEAPGPMVSTPRVQSVQPFAPPSMGTPLFQRSIEEELKNTPSGQPGIQPAAAPLGQYGVEETQAPKKGKK